MKTAEGGVIPRFIDSFTLSFGVAWRPFKAGRGRHKLRRTFSRYPDNWPGIGLLILRVAIGVVLIVQRVDYLVGQHSGGLVTWVVSRLAVASGVLLVIGYLTPISGALVVLISIGGLVLSLRNPSPHFINPALAGCVILAVAIAIICLGPGAFSIDARLFGRREIVIPDSSHPPEP